MISHQTHTVRVTLWTSHDCHVSLTVRLSQCEVVVCWYITQGASPAYGIEIQQTVHLNFFRRRCGIHCLSVNIAGHLSIYRPSKKICGSCKFITVMSVNFPAWSDHLLIFMSMNFCSLWSKHRDLKLNIVDCLHFRTVVLNDVICRLASRAVAITLSWCVNLGESKIE